MYQQEQQSRFTASRKQPNTTSGNPNMPDTLSKEDRHHRRDSMTWIEIKHKGHAILWQCPKCRVMFHQKKAMCPNCGARTS